MPKTAKVFYTALLAGYISETDAGYEFSYDEDYLKADHPMPVCLTLPLASTTYTSKVLFPFFDGLIPEGWLLDLTTSYWKLNPNDRFELLLATCRDTIGAVTVIPND